jgi:hypothetical protein
MRVEIIFCSSSTPKVMFASAVYTKGSLLCVEMLPDKKGNVLIVKYPLCNIFSIAHRHGDHAGSTKRRRHR